MNLVVLTAAGCGSRVGGATPKQFVSVNGMPVIVHTMRAFQYHPEIDVICVVTLPEWVDVVAEYGRQYGITKLRHIVVGGASGQESIKRGLDELHSVYADDDIVLVHDGVRPMVSAEIISDCIRCVRANGNAIAAIPCTEAILQTTDGGVSAVTSIPRDALRRTQTPHGFYLGDIWAAQNDALACGITNTVACCTLMVALGRRVFFSRGAEQNLKLTTVADFEIFRALLGRVTK